MIEITVKFKHIDGENDGSEGEEKHRIGRIGEDTDVKKLVAFAYQQFARRDVFVTALSAVHWVPQHISVKMGQGGKVQIGNKGYSLDEKALESLQSVEIQRKKKKRPIQQTTPKETILSPVENSSNRSLEIYSESNIRDTNIRSRKEMKTSPSGMANVGERYFQPSETEKQEGIVYIIVFDPPRAMVFDPVSDATELPIRRGEKVIVQEKIFRKRRERTTELFKIVINERTMEIPANWFIDAPTGRSDGILLNRTCDTTPANMLSSSGESISGDSVPLQGSRRPAQSQGKISAVPNNIPPEYRNMPFLSPAGELINPDGTSYQDNIDIRSRR